MGKNAGKREIYEPEAQVVRQIYTWVAEEGIGIRTVAQRLNNSGVPCPSVGKLTYPDPNRQPRWGKHQVSRLLQHPAYQGVTYAWRTRRPATAKDRRRPDFNASEQRNIRPESEWIKLPDGTTPAIVAPELWQRAQVAMKQNRGASARNAKNPSLLRGMVVCGVCKQPMYADIENSSMPSRQRIYRCSSRDKATGACGGGRIPAEALEQWAWEQVAATLKNPSVLAEEVERRQQRGPDQALTNDLEVAKRELAKRERAREKLLKELSMSEDDRFPWALVHQEIKRLEEEKPHWQKTITELEERLASYQTTVGQLEALQRYCERASYRIDTLGFEEKRVALKALEITVIGNGREWHIQRRIPIESGVVSTTSQHVMPPACRDLQRPLDMLLPAHVGQIVREAVVVCWVQERAVGHIWRDALLAAQMARQLRQRLHGKHRHILDQRRLRRIHLRHEDRLDATLARQRHHRQDTVGMAQTAVQAQLAEKETALRGADTSGRAEWGHLLGGHQNRDGDGQVVGRASLAQIRRRQVDGDAPQRKDAAAILDGSAHPLLGLVHRRIGQPHDSESRQSVPDVHLDLDQRTVQPDHRAGTRLRQHAGRLPFLRPLARAARYYARQRDKVNRCAVVHSRKGVSLFVACILWYKPYTWREEPDSHTSSVAKSLAHSSYVLGMCTHMPGH